MAKIAYYLLNILFIIINYLSLGLLVLVNSLGSYIIDGVHFIIIIPKMPSKTRIFGQCYKGNAGVVSWIILFTFLSTDEYINFYNRNFYFK